MYNYIQYLLNRNNTVDIDLIECTEKENFSFDKVESNQEVHENKIDNDAAVFAVRKVLRKR